MAHLARNHRLTRRRWLLAGLGMGVSVRAFRAQGAPTLLPRLDGETLYVSASDLHFLTGKPLERLQEGNAVTFMAQLSLSLDGNKTFVRQQPQKFVFSYDILQYKFQVAKPGGLPRRGLTASAAESWCIDSLAISTSGISADQLVWLRLDLRVADLKDQANMLGDTGLSVRGLVEAMSHPARALQKNWTVDIPPFRLSNLKRAAARGSGSG